MSIVNGISIKQPFAELILQGKKTSEYRTIRTKIRGRVYIYTSLKERNEESLWEKAGNKLGGLPLGRIVGSLEIIEYKEHIVEGYAYILRHPRRMNPIKSKNHGSPVFWRPII